MNSLLTNSDSLGGLDNVYSDSGERGTRQEMIRVVNKKRRRQAGRMTDTLCRAQVDSLKKTV